MTLKEITNAVKLEGSLPNSRQFNIQLAEKHNAEVDVMSQKIYDAYLSRGVELATERQETYKNENYRTASFYNKCITK